MSRPINPLRKSFAGGVRGGSFSKSPLPTVLRSPIYGDLRLGEYDPGTEHDIISQGVTEGKVRAFFGDDAWAEADALCNPPVVIDECCHNGSLPPQNGYIRVEGDAAAIGAVKKAEYTDGTVVRLFEKTGKGAAVTLQFFDRRFPVSLAPHEIKTLLIENDSCREVYMTED